MIIRLRAIHLMQFPVICVEGAWSAERLSQWPMARVQIWCQ